MEYFFRIRQLIIITTVISLSFFNSCRQAGDSLNHVNVYLPQKMAVSQQEVSLQTSSHDISLQKYEMMTGPGHYNIVIPGNTMKSAEFQPGSDNKLSIEGAALNIPKGAINETKRFSITGLHSEDLPPIPPEISNVTGSFYSGYRFLPHGILFDSTAAITMAYDTCLIPEGYTAEDIFTYYFDETDHMWKALERDSIDHISGQVVSRTLHFTDMINGIIRVPESPETNGFVPTTMKDIKTADPASGITLINPPVANNEGDAELSYPLKIPAGRAGMQPSLVLQYSSDGSNGWTGYGWEIDIPGISVDISWGVPRYSETKESETYLFGGSQLTPVAHLGDYRDRTPEKRFYQRNEDSFSKIIRHSNSPGNYWWEVTTKDGVRNYYGGLPDSGFLKTAVSLDNQGNIGYWALKKTIDLHGNFVSYSYDKPAGCGQQLYISEITYSGYNETDGPYKITFLRDDETNTYQRKDTRINARYGFILRDRELLRRINITYNNEPVRSYTFKFKDGQFLKTLLESITELDAAGTEFYSYKFNYHDDLHLNNNTNPYTGSKIWKLPDDNLKSPYLNLFLDNISALGGSGSVGYSGGVSLTIGPSDWRLYSKSMTGGGNVSYIGSDNEGFLTLIDINGDGIPDKIFKKDNEVYYRPNLLSYPSDQMFGEKRKITGISDFSISKFSGIGWGVEAHPFIGFLGFSNVISKTKTTVYFEDFNSDGLVDLVKNGVVYFNHIDDNGNPVFTTSSALTPNPLHANSQIDLTILPDPAEEQAKLEAQFPLHDAVRMFRAPFSGIIRINAPVNLVEDTSKVAVSDTLKDGVIVSIQHNGSLLWKEEIEGDDYTVKEPDSGPVSILQGDHIYFRVQSGFNGSYDRVFWDPEILYDLIDGSDTLVNIKDSNRKPVGRFKSSEDFILNGLQPIGMPKKGAVKIRTSFFKPPTSDTIKLEIVYTDTLGKGTDIFYQEYDCSQIMSGDSINFNLNVLKGEYVQFRVLSSTNIDWSKIKWNIGVEYSRIDDGTPVTGNDGKPLLSFKAVPEFSTMFNNIVRYELPVVADTSFMLSAGLDTVDNFLHPVKISPSLAFGNNGSDTVILSVKSKDKIYDRKKYHFSGDIIDTGDTLIADVQFGDTLYFEYHFPDFGLAQSNTLASVIIGNDTLNPLKASVLSTIRPGDEIFGSLYRGWGQFDYNGNDDRANSVIDESLLKFTDMRNIDIGTMQDTSDLNGVQNPQGEIFNIMIPYAEKVAYMGTDEQVYILPEYISSSRLGQKNVYVEPIVLSGSGLNAISKVTENNSKSFALGASPGFLSVSGSYSWENGNLTIDMMDMNGDRYPDLLSTNNIQYTGVKGVLTGDAVNHNLGGHFSKAEAYGVTMGGNFVHAKSDNAGTKAPSKSVKGNIGNSSKTNKNANSAQETSKSSIGLSGNFSSNNDHTEETWLDINGDGLPDKIYNNGTVYLNMGYSFAPPETWNFDAICVGESKDYGGGLGVNIENGSFIAGVGVSLTSNKADETFMDINADGLPDMVKGTSVYFNTGSGFAPSVEWPGLGTLDEGESVGQSVNIATTFGFVIPIPFFPLKVEINPSDSRSTGTSHTLTQLADIDGDGFPDFLSSDREDQLNVKSSNIFRTNLLKNVENPLGSSFELDYLLTPAIYTHPGGKIALKSVKLFDGLPGDGTDTIYTSFEYEDGFYSRHERKFYGFSSVKTNFYNSSDQNPLYRTMVQNFSNRDYYSRGDLLAETLFDNEGRKQEGTQSIYSLRDIHTGKVLPEPVSQSDSLPVFVSLDETKEYSFRGSSLPRITTRVTYKYDTVGNISGYTDYSSGNVKDSYSVEIQYHHNAEKYLLSIPSSHKVTTIEGLRRKSETDINDIGDVTQIRKYVTGNHAAQFDLEYDEYGNLSKITRPANYRGERMWYEYDYDPVVHSFITGIKDAYGYNSSTAYDYKWGEPVGLIDRNNQKMEYSYDDCGRVISVTGPDELASGRPYTIAFEYHPEADVPYSHIMHYDSVYDSNIETYSFIDGLDRLVQIKKTAMLFENDASEDTPGFIVSGKLMYDALGRVNEVYQPVFESAANPGLYNSNHDNIQPASADYDVLDRIAKIILPDGSVISHNYNIGAFKGESMYIDSLTDALGNISVTYTKANGRKAATIKKSNEGDINTEYEYNGIGELIAETDPMGNKIKSMYDMIGNRVSVDHPDAGLTEFIYDDAGNKIKKITANLRKQIPDGGAINFKYDYERLTEIVYPRNIQNRVNYTYGAPGAPFNRAGRIVLMQDASGGQEFYYDRFGQVIKTIRTVQLGESDMRTWIWSSTYDTWNRVQTMTYPDGEKVTYSYNRAGNLMQMDGEKLGRSYSYIKRIGYNKFEKQVYLRYGNGSVTTYNYEPERLRLKQMKVTTGNSPIMDNTYTYDAMSNILDVTDNPGASGNIGGVSSHHYIYDELYRLSEASGTFKRENEESNYSLVLRYDNIGKILQKNQIHKKNNEIQDATSYDYNYKYEGMQPDVPTAVGQRVFTYDGDGNQTSWQDTITNDFRQLAWDEEDRLTLISDNGYLNRYVYDATGERVIKSYGGSQGVYINGAPIGIINHSDNNYNVYVSPYFVFQEGKFTKHYYNGSTRITSKIGNGQFQNQYRPGVFEITAGSINYINRQQQLKSAVEEYERQSGIPPGPPTLKGIYADPAFSGTGYPDPGSPEDNTPRGWPKKPVFAQAGGPPGAPVQWGDEITNDNTGAGFGFIGNGNIEENQYYFYHTDHLGSTCYITNLTGNVTQYISYMPYGETFTEQHSDWDSPYKFNAMEKDAETGLYYDGARYYDPKASIWIDADPQAEDYAFFSPYIYEFDNPVKGELIRMESEAAIFTADQKPARKPVHFYLVPASGNSSPSSITNLSALSSVPGFHELNIKEEKERSAEDDPVKKRVKYSREKKLAKLAEEKPKENAKEEGPMKEIKKESEPEIAKPADLSIPKDNALEMKSDKEQIDIRSIEVLDNKHNTTPVSKIKSESIATKEKVTTLKNSEKMLE